MSTDRVERAAAFLYRRMNKGGYSRSWSNANPTDRQHYRQVASEFLAELGQS